MTFGIAVMARLGTDEEPHVIRAYSLACESPAEAAAHLSRLACEVLEELDDDTDVKAEMASPDSLRASLDDGITTWCAVAADVSPLYR